MNEAHASRSIGGFVILDVDAETAIALVATRGRAGRATELHFANTNFVVACHPFADAIQVPQAIVLNDGVGLDLAAWMRDRRFFRANLNGTDFVPRLLAAQPAETRVFLLGARPDVAEAAARAFARVGPLRIVGVRDGYDGMADDGAVLEHIARCAPDILLVALGDPMQARWIASHRGRHAVPLVVGVGALFDFVSHAVPRAPRAVRALRLEWLYRLAREPRRLLRRYSIDLLVFFRHCWRTQRAERIAARRMPHPVEPR